MASSSASVKKRERERERQRNSESYHSRYDSNNLINHINPDENVEDKHMNMNPLKKTKIIHHHNSNKEDENKNLNNLDNPTNRNNPPVSTQSAPELPPGSSLGSPNNP